MICDQDPLRRRPREIHGAVKMTGEVRLDDDKIGQMGFWTLPNHQDQAVGCQRRKNILTAVQFGYGRSGFGGYLENVGLVL